MINGRLQPGQSTSNITILDANTRTELNVTLTPSGDVSEDVGYVDVEFTHIGGDPSERDVPISITIGGTVDDDDYQIQDVSGDTIYFPAGQSSIVMSIHIAADGMKELSEQMSLQFSTTALYSPLTGDVSTDIAIDDIDTLQFQSQLSDYTFNKGSTEIIDLPALNAANTISVSYSLLVAPNWVTINPTSGQLEIDTLSVSDIDSVIEPIIACAEDVEEQVCLNPFSVTINP